MLSSEAEIQDFAMRWKRARIAGLNGLISPERIADDELEMLHALPPKARELALKNVFDNGRKFGLSFARHYGMVLELSDLRALLPKLGVTCLSGQFHRRDEAVVREKAGCLEGIRLGSYYCDYWREAIDGLTMGISDHVLFARHESCRHGDDRCIDVWFEDGGEKSREAAKGAIPDWVDTRLQLIVKKFGSDGVKIKFEGLSEGVLYCQITSASAPSCSDQGNWEKIIAAEVANSWPGVKLKNTTPVAVYGEGF